MKLNYLFWLFRIFYFPLLLLLFPFQTFPFVLLFFIILNTALTSNLQLSDLTSFLMQPMTEEMLVLVSLCATCRKENSSFLKTSAILCLYAIYLPVNVLCFRMKRQRKKILERQRLLNEQACEFVLILCHFLILKLDFSSMENLGDWSF